MALIAKPNPLYIECLYRITGRDLTPWDAETLLIMAIARQSMANRATNKDCEQPYFEYIDESTLEDRGEEIVSTFFARFRENK